MWSDLVYRLTGKSFLTEKSLDRDGRVITLECDRAAKAIENRLAEVSLGNRPLFVLIGENHSMPSHMVFQMGVMDRLRRIGIPFGVALEYPSNSVEDHYLSNLETYSGESAPGRDKAETLESIRRELATNPTRHRLLYGVAFLTDTPYAPYSASTLIHYLDKYQIPIAFIDAAVDVDGYLKQDDPDTKAAIQEAERISSTKAGEIIRFEDRLGMVARNIHMVQAGLKFATALEAKLILTVTGNAHVLGYNDVGPEMVVSSTETV